MVDEPTAQTLLAAAGSRRLQILQLIWDQERTVGEIAAQLPVSMAAVSQHLAKLRAARLVSMRPEGRRRYYRAQTGLLTPLQGTRDSLRTAADGGSGGPPAVPQSQPPAGSLVAADPKRPPNASPVIVHPPRDDFDEMGAWYRQGLRARVIALEGARGTLESEPRAAMAAVRRLARSLTRPSIAERFEEIGATARDVLESPTDQVEARVGRLVGALRQASVTDESAKARILIVEDSPVETLLYSTVLKGPNREVITATTAEEAQAILDREEVSLVVTDLGLPGADGRELLIGLGRRPRTAAIPVILLTGRDDVPTRTEALSLGADAFYTKPLEGAVLSSAVSMMLERAAEARQMGRHDPLTGLRNRSVFLDDVRQLAATAIRARIDLSLAIVDVEGLGGVNARHGTDAGDAILKELAHTMREQFRASDMIARWEGGRFAVLFTNAAPHGAAIALNKLLDVTTTVSVSLPDDSEHFIVWHAGVASIREPAGIEDAVARATRRLQVARRPATKPIIWADTPAAEGKRTVLVIEDDDILADLIEHRLRREGFETEHFSDGAEALAALPDVDASAVVLDTTLPGAQGIEVLRRLREAPSFAGVPVMVLTFGSEHDAARALRLGANDSLAKPFSVEELVARVSRLVSDFEERLP